MLMQVAEQRSLRSQKTTLTLTRDYKKKETGNAHNMCLQPYDIQKINNIKQLVCRRKSSTVASAEHYILSSYKSESCLLYNITSIRVRNMDILVSLKDGRTPY